MVDEHTRPQKLIEERVAAEQGEQPATGQATDEYHLPSNAGPELTETYEIFSSTEIIRTLRENEAGAAGISRSLYSRNTDSTTRMADGTNSPSLTTPRTDSTKPWPVARKSPAYSISTDSARHGEKPQHARPGGTAKRGMPSLTKALPEACSTTHNGTRQSYLHHRVISYHEPQAAMRVPVVFYHFRVLAQEAVFESLQVDYLAFF